MKFDISELLNGQHISNQEERKSSFGVPGWSRHFQKAGWFVVEILVEHVAKTMETFRRLQWPLWKKMEFSVNILKKLNSNSMNEFRRIISPIEPLCNDSFQLIFYFTLMTCWAENLVLLYWSYNLQNWVDR